MSEQVSDSADVIDNTDASRFELRADGRLAELVYRIRGDRLVLIHTEVPSELEGRRIGGRLVTAAVDRAVREGLTLAPFACLPAAGWSGIPRRRAGRSSTGTVEQSNGTAVRWNVNADGHFHAAVAPVVPGV